MYSNVGSLINNFDEVMKIASLHNTNIIDLIEIWQYTEIYNDIVSIPEYKVSVRSCGFFNLECKFKFGRDLRRCLGDLPNKSIRIFYAPE
ncbi:hypothetical protein GJ496_010927, partial [Pomphorhynchus laevis]